MVVRGLGALLSASLVLGLGAPVALASSEQKLVLVEHSEAMIEALESKGYDVGYVTDHTEAAVYVDDAGEARLRAEGYRLGDVVASQQNFEQRKAEIAATKDAEAAAAEVAKNGLSKSAKSRGAVNVPGKVVIQRSYTFSNYAGRFLYVEAHNKDHTDTTGPAMSFTYTGPNGTSQVYNLSNPGPQNAPGITPDGPDAEIGGNKIRDTDAGAGAQYMYHRALVALRGADAGLQASQISVRVADANGAFDTATPTEWTGKALPPRVAGFHKDFITKYMDPTEVYNRMDQLAQDNSGIMEAINLPHKTNGYQRQANVMLEGTTVNPSATTGLTPNPSTGNSAANAASRARAVQLFSKAMGHEGGNNITAELKAPPAGTLNAPLSVTVTDGTWEEVDPADTNAADGFTRIQVPVKDITVNLATNEAGAVITTAKQVVDAINASPAANALVTASTFAGNAGDGVVVPTPNRSYNFPLGTTNTGQTYASSRLRLMDGIRGGTVYWTGNATATPPTLTRNDARHVTRGPFQPKVYRIGKDRSNNAVGVFLYCQQHAREWVTPITCVETAQRLVTNYATDPTTKEYVDKLNIFILPSVNPDGGHASFHENPGQRKNLTNYCSPTENGGGAGSRFQWGVDLNRNNTVGTLYQGFDGASTLCTNDVFTGLESGPGSGIPRTEPEIANEHWVADTFKGIKFANNIHTHGGYFMWAPGAYKDAGRETLPAPNIGIENYFFDVADTILSHIRSSRNTAILPQRVGPIADVLYSAAGNSSDEAYYKRGIIGYSFEAGAERLSVSDTGAISRISVGFQPCFGGPGTHGGFNDNNQAESGRCVFPNTNTPNPLLVNEGHDSTMEFAEGNYGMIEAALEYHEDATPPQTTIEYSAAQTSGEPINFRFNWLTEPSVIYYTTDGSDPVIVPDNKTTPADESCANTSTTGTRCYNNQGPRMPGEVLTLGLGAHTVKWTSVDIKGNREAVKSQRLLVAADDAEAPVTGTVPATLALSLGAFTPFDPFIPGVPRDYTTSAAADVISTAGNATLSVSDGGANPGHLMNGTFKMAQPLQASASSMGGTAAAGGALGAGARALMNYSAPVSNDRVTLTLKQPIGTTDPLRTGTYSKTLTFTLSTTSP
ncbi:chitobiase/beta-hexosaminidase C-terminal domain-containing protein [Solirubrobacter sp. CPCC 204708]|uniref:M14 family zinc carboxypeptidase n=1 Tax=Solirubrobacter deserti TaxID=2282478 RepID=A0ABT4RN23_9ACTN|nr:M14 family zinc carboxypeptidase [Solirubrobacter deserti]MBE2318011.1 chitobiase/beta-hexosaminidase C-terminal domain-containing protein [Solirubrobacter deserti]MDA0139690.1 M14 family zinc carboxypeptidase [Solirubrobacter deserti]